MRERLPDILSQPGSGRVEFRSDPDYSEYDNLGADNTDLSDALVPRRLKLGAAGKVVAKGMVKVVKKMFSITGEMLDRSNAGRKVDGINDDLED